MRVVAIGLGAVVVQAMLGCTAQPDDDISLSVVTTSDGTTSEPLIVTPSAVERDGDTTSMVFDSLDLLGQWHSIVVEPVLDGRVVDDAEIFPVLASDVVTQIVFVFSDSGCRYVGSVASPSVPVVRVESTC